MHARLEGRRNAVSVSVASSFLFFIPPDLRPPEELGRHLRGLVGVVVDGLLAHEHHVGLLGRGRKETG